MIATQAVYVVDPVSGLAVPPGSGKYQVAFTPLTDGQSSALRLDVNGLLLTSNRLLTTQDLVTIAGGNMTVLAQLYDAFGQQLRSVSPTGGINQLQANLNESSPAIATWNGSALNITTTPIVYGPLNSRNFHELVIVANATVVNTGYTLSYQVLDPTSTLQTVWSETFSATGIQYICVGPGYPNGPGAVVRNMSLGISGQLTIVAVGTSCTIRGGAWLRTN